ncbi:hypothetical protein AB4Y45_32965 [Paraburkholderia sp. EG287A]|uniref:hypothetical protein n=1 Tax=Paraburkholderia sp. EG287A TaxID=3237012 RepID=UPI0034D1FC85
MGTNAIVGDGPRDADEWKPWADKLICSVKGVLETGIPECYADYPTPVEGFCFELHADLPYGRPALLAQVLANLVEMPEFKELDALFEQKFGCPILGRRSEAQQLTQQS